MTTLLVMQNEALGMFLLPRGNEGLLMEVSVMSSVARPHCQTFHFVLILSV